MKPLLLCLLLLLTVGTYAQTVTKRVIKIDQNTVVKDEAGTVYPYELWSKLTGKGEYSLRAANPKVISDTSSFVIYKLSDEEKAQQIARMPKPNESAMFKVGDAFRYFKDRDITGEKFDAKKLSGKILVLNFWFINCPPCREEIPDLNGLVDAYKDNSDVVFIAIALDEEYDIKEYTKKQPFKYHLIERGHLITDDYKLRVYPTNVVVNKEGKIAFSSTGGYTGNITWMKKAIDQSLAEKPNEVAVAQKSGK